MQLAKFIFTVFTASIILIGNNGFILEQYFCSGCNTEKQEIAFFEFGEVNHKHQHLHDCSEHKHEHDCFSHDDDHINNTIIKYVSLDILFSNSDIPEIAKTSIIELSKHISHFFTNDYNLTNFHKLNKAILKIPILINISDIDKDICIINSVLRL